MFELIVKWSERQGGISDVEDHPLCSNPDSAWCQYFKDNEVLLQINKDVRRLCPEISFFQQATEFPFKDPVTQRVLSLSRRISNELLNAENLTQNRSGMNNLVKTSRKYAEEEYKELWDGQEAHWQVVERILFVYCKLNPGVQYVQGMNEILGPIYYVFASDPNVLWREFAEADSYYCFQYLMSEIKDNFIRTMDSSKFGIEFQMRCLFGLLKDTDLTLYTHIAEKQEIRPEYFAFRWLSLLLSQEFLLPDVIRIWDSLFADENRFQFLLYVYDCSFKGFCVQTLISVFRHVRDALMNNDFSSNIRLLQVMPCLLLFGS
ncbi:unnamed protein product [Soboliphyme baturini]|uniref:Rab-GAP TBC domain-containing protein n=1 Tax=Soboliphyme baturini TaxID=241478 RepID=A0A183IG42_9BILA|nr:unnamed protein product [Soboliphyme baturini]